MKAESEKAKKFSSSCGCCCGLGGEVHAALGQFAGDANGQALVELVSHQQAGANREEDADIDAAAEPNALERLRCLRLVGLIAVRPHQP